MKTVITIIFASLIFFFSAAHVVALEIALIGDKSKREAFQALAKEMKGTITAASGMKRATVKMPDVVFTVTESSDDPFAIANQLRTADMALIVVDSTQGPLPIIREQILVARQTVVPEVALFFVKTRELRVTAPKDAAELLELEEIEMRDLLNNYTLKGDASTALFDSDLSGISKAKYAKGIPAAKEHLGTVTAKRPSTAKTETVTKFECTYYLLTGPETDGIAAALSDGDTLDVWVEGKSASGKIETKTSHKPGDNGEFFIVLTNPLPVAMGSHVIFAKKSKVIGVARIIRIKF